MGDAMSTRVAVLGLGKMGSALARRLADSGYELTLWNRTRARAEELGAGRVLATPAEAVHDAEVVITSLTGADAVRAVYGGPAGALAAAHGQAFIEMSTTGPDVVAELQPQVAATGSTLVDAPIVGAPPALAAGRAAIVVGGTEADVERVRPVLSLLGEVRHVGPLGSGARLKLVNNSMFGAISTAAAELQVAGELAGLDPDQVFWVLARQAPALELRRAGYLQGQHEPTLFAVRDLRKDLDLAIDLFHRTDARAPVTEVVRGVVDEASADAGDLDITAVITRYRPQPARR